MSNDYDNTNRGSIWKNDRMRDGKQDPQFTGTLNVEGVEYWISAWKRKAGAKSGSPALNFTLNRKDANKAPNPAKQEAPQEEYDDTEIPF